MVMTLLQIQVQLLGIRHLEVAEAVDVEEEVAALIEAAVEILLISLQPIARE